MKATKTKRTRDVELSAELLAALRRYATERTKHSVHPGGPADDAALL